MREALNEPAGASIGEFNLLIRIFGLLDRIGTVSGALQKEALEWCWRRIREDAADVAWNQNQVMGSASEQIKSVAKLTGCDLWLVDEAARGVLAPTKARLVHDELERFAAAHQISERLARRTAG